MVSADGSRHQQLAWYALQTQNLGILSMNMTKEGAGWGTSGTELFAVDDGAPPHQQETLVTLMTSLDALMGRKLRDRTF